MMTWMHHMGLKISFTVFLNHNLLYILDEKEFVPRRNCSSEIDEGYERTDADTKTVSGKDNLELRYWNI